MTQQKIIDTLDELMPKIASTKDPEGVLLKFAKENNLYTSQVEKLGHAFNQCKTLVGLQKQANRGDSFTILDVPAMVKKYASYTPADVLTKKEKEIHKKVDKIVKSASVLDTPEDRVPLPDYLQELQYKGAEIDTGSTSEYDLSKSSGNFDITFDKKASEQEEVDKVELLKEAHESLKEAIKVANTAQASARELISIKCASITDMLRRKGPQAWSEVVEDTVYRFGSEKSAAAIDAVENYLEVNHIPYTVADLTKKAYHSVLVTDRHNMFDTMQYIMESADLYKEASSELISLNKEEEQIKNCIKDLLQKEAAGKNKPRGNAANIPPSPVVKSKGKDDKLINIDGTALVQLPALPLTMFSKVLNAPKDALETYSTYTKHIKDMMPSKDKYKKDFDTEAQKLNKQYALEELLFTDPIIAEADINDVQDIYNTIASVSPRFAENPRMMSTALKEALQYGAVPISMLKDIADFESKANKSALDAQTLKDNLYKI